MRDKCVNAVQQAAGRQLTKAEIDGIENRVRAGMRSVAAQDIDAWRGMSQADRTAKGAEFAKQQLEQEAELAKQRKLLQISKQIETTDRIQERLFSDPEKAHAKKAREKAVKGDIEETYAQIGGIKADYMRGTMGAIDSMKHGQNFVARAFDVDNPAMERDIIREIYRGADGSTGNDVAKGAAEQISKTTNAMRERFNSAGGNVGQLDYGYVPIRHSQSKVLGNGSDAQRAAWADKVMPLLDRSKYLDDAGNPMTDAALRKVLTGDDRETWERANIAAKGQGVAPRETGVWDTIAYGGVSKIVPGETTGGASRANQGSAHRVLHFADADAHMSYNKEFGEGSLLDALNQHISGMAKNISLVERYGPNPTRNMQTQMQLTAVHDNTQLRTLEGGMTSVGAYWNYISGATNTPVNPAMAQRFQTVRTTVSAIKLQGTLLAALGDVGTLFVTAGYNKVPFFKSLGTAARLALPGSKDFRSYLSSQGLIAEQLEHGLNRWGTDNLSTTWASNLSAATMKFGGVTGWTDALRTGFQTQMMKGLGEIASKPWGELTEWDRRSLGRSGITPEDWGVINTAKLGEYGGNHFLTPDSIYGAQGSFESEKGHPISVDQHEANIRQEIADARAKHLDLKSTLGAKLAEIDADASLTPEQKDTQKASARGRVSGFLAKANSLESKLPDTLTAYSKKLPGLIDQYIQGRKNTIVPKVLGMIREEGEYAVLNPDLAAKVITSATPGTWSGELQKTFMQFKAFPIAMMTRHWGRIADMQRSGDFKVEGAPALANPLAYGAALVLSTTLMGAVSNQVKDIISGKDPEPMWGDPKKSALFWTRAFMKGGGAGFAGDTLNSALTSRDYGSALGAVVGGPVGSVLFDPLHIAYQNSTDAANGKDTHVSADMLKFAQNNTPLINLFYWKTVWNRLLFDNIAENLSPGVTQRNANRSNKQYGNEFYWQPGQSSPDRAPNLSNAFGGQ